MNAKDFNVRSALLKCGKEQFLLHGFEGASLRAICKNAGVTTGAFYAYFDKKDALFSAIVDPMLHAYYQMYDGVVRRAMQDVKNNEANELEAIEFICAHRDEFRLLFDCSAGTAYADFRKTLLDDLFMSSYQACFDRYAGGPVDPGIVRLFVRMKFIQYMELIYGGYSMQDIRRLVRRYAAFTEAGFARLLEEIKDETA